MTGAQRQMTIRIEKIAVSSARGIHKASIMMQNKLKLLRKSIRNISKMRYYKHQAKRFCDCRKYIKTLNTH